MTPDVNILVAASRADHPLYRPALDGLTRALEEVGVGASVEILPMVAAGFLRIVTHPKIFPNPTPTGDTVAFLSAVLAASGVNVPELGGE